MRMDKLLLIRVLKKVYHQFKRVAWGNLLWLKYAFSRNELIIDEEKIENIWITNNRGGGAAFFLEREVDLTNALIIQRAGYSLGTDKFLWVIADGNKYLIEKNELYNIKLNRIRRICINTLVDYDNIISIFEFAKHIKSMNKECRLYYYVHDYFCVCPCINLVREGQFCFCDCHKKNCNIFYKEKPVSVSEWQNAWRIFWKSVDQVVCFSNDSKNILCKVYGDCLEDKISIRPHNMEYFAKANKVRLTGQKVKIAVIGRISTEFKGKTVVKNLIKDFADNCEIVLVGTGRFQIWSLNRNVKYYPKYTPDELETIIDKERITHVVFPSICPESFSYVVSELMILGIPVLGFDIGAQGEKLCEYSFGQVFSTEEKMFTEIKHLIEGNKV